MLAPSRVLVILSFCCLHASAYQDCSGTTPRASCSNLKQRTAEELGELPVLQEIQDETILIQKKTLLTSGNDYLYEEIAKDINEDDDAAEEDEYDEADEDKDDEAEEDKDEEEKVAEEKEEEDAVEEDVEPAELMKNLQLLQLQPDQKLGKREQAVRMVVNDVVSALGLGKDSVKSLDSRAPHEGKSTDFTVPYEVRNGASGLGIFVKKPISKGEVVYRFNAEKDIPIYEEDMPVLKRLLQPLHPTIALQLSRWTYAWPDFCENKCMVFEMGDSRYVNDAKTPEEDNVESDEAGIVQVATKPIMENTELLETSSMSQGRQEPKSAAPAWWTDYVDELKRGLHKHAVESFVHSAMHVLEQLGADKLSSA